MRASIILISTLALAACNMSADAQEGDEAPGRTTQRSFNVAGFDGVALGGAYNVVVAVGPAHSVRVEGDAEEIERMEVKVEDGDLQIGRKKGKNWELGWRRDRGPVTVYVTTPTLRSAAIGGSGDIRVDRVEGRDFAASIGGSGDISIASMRVDEASFSIAGSGEIAAAGSAGATKVSVAGSGDIDLDRLQSRTASVSIVGAGDVRARASETASVSIMGSGDVTMGGTAKCSITKRGSGNVRCGA